MVVCDELIGWFVGFECLGCEIEWVFYLEVVNGIEFFMFKCVFCGVVYILLMCVGVLGGI